MQGQYAKSYNCALDATSNVKCEKTIKMININQLGGRATRMVAGRKLAYMPVKHVLPGFPSNVYVKDQNRLCSHHDLSCSRGLLGLEIL